MHEDRDIILKSKIQSRIEIFYCDQYREAERKVKYIYTILLYKYLIRGAECSVFPGRIRFL